MNKYSNIQIYVDIPTIFSSISSGNDWVVTSGGKLPSQLIYLIGFQRFRRNQHNVLGANKSIGAEIRRRH